MGRRRRRSPGQILVLAALVMVLILGLIGSGVDYGLLLVEETRTQHAIDAAALAASHALAAGPTPGVAAAQSTATEYLRLHGFQNGVGNTTITFAAATPAPSGPVDRVILNVVRSRSTLFWNVFGIQQMQIRGQATARGIGGGLSDIVVSFDESSMSSADMANLRSALTTFVGQLQPSTTNPRSAQIGLARFRGQICPSGDGVWTWGGNDRGQLGQGVTGADNPIPIVVPFDDAVTDMAAGGSHTLAYLSSAGAPSQGFGANDAGQLGDGTTTDNPNPGTVTGLTNVTDIAGGRSHSLALKSDGTVWAWGENSRGQLGNGTTTDSNTPVQVTLLGGILPLTGVTAISAGGDFSLAVRSDGTVWGWGDNSYGQLGSLGALSNVAQVLFTVPTWGTRRITSVAAGGRHSLALADDYTVWSWGDNSSGQLGRATAFPSIPGPITSLNWAYLIAAGDSHSLAATFFLPSRLWAWGENNSGQVGDGSVTDQAAPVAVSGMSGLVRAIAAGRSHSLAVKLDGTTWAWGANDHGQLGSPPAAVTGTTTPTATSTRTPTVTTNSTATPVLTGTATRTPTRTTTPAASLTRTATAGPTSTPPATATVTPTSVPSNPFYSNVPIPVAGLPGASAVSAGSIHSLARADAPCGRDAHVLLMPTSDRDTILQVVNGPASGCPALPAQPPTTTPPLPATSYGCPLSPVGGARRYVKAGFDVTFIPSTWDLWSPTNGGRSDARKVLVLLADGRNRAYGMAEPTADTNTVSTSNTVKPGSDRALNSPTALPDDVEVYVVGFFGGSESGLTGTSPPGCPAASIPAGVTSVDTMLINSSSSTAGSCDHYYPLAKNGDLSQIFTAIASRIARGFLLN